MAKAKWTNVGSNGIKRRANGVPQSFAQNYLVKVPKLRHPEDEDVEDEAASSSSSSTSASSSSLLSSSQDSSSERSAEMDDYSTLQRVALIRANQFSPEMIKYWKQRRSLFTLFDGSSSTGQLPLLDKESWYSVTPEPIAARIAQRCRSRCVLDPFCGVGGNAIQFALTCERVVAIDVDPVKIRLARHNARVYGVEKYITFLQGDCRDFVGDWQAAHATTGSSSTSRWQGCETLDFDVVFLSPPWGGVEYRTLKRQSVESDDTSSSCSSAETLASFYPLSALKPMHGKDLFQLFRQISRNICMFLPRTIDLNELAGLINDEKSSTSSDTLLIDVEEQWLNGRCKALSCFFGDLVDWQEAEEEPER